LNKLLGFAVFLKKEGFADECFEALDFLKK
jgi:hypothetical protein